jgi:bifunctional DNase/RNase
MENITAVRPMTHDLICNILDTIGYEVNRIEINDISSETYYANIFLTDSEGKEYIIDSRPSDAIAISLRTKSPIYVTAKVVADGTISTDQAKDKQEAEEFRQFIQDLKPSDFKKISDNTEESNQ